MNASTKTKSVDLVLEELEGKLSGFEVPSSFVNRGEVIEVKDGVVSVVGLGKAAMGEEVIFEHRERGQVIGLDEDRVWIIVLGEFEKIKEGDTVRSTGKILQIGVSNKMLGRVIDPLGNPLDGKQAIKFEKQVSIEKIAPGVILRSPVNTPLRTGIKVIDALIPIGRGQRELIIGDRGTGKTSIVLDAIANQKDVISIYVAIGQKQQSVAQIWDKLSALGALENTIIVAATASSPPALQYIAPFVACSIGEYFMEKGKDVLIVYDDLTKHAWAYRQISLILKKPSGREAYPGDIFYLHSRLLERACKLEKGGSLTALPIIETQAGDISTYIPTNVISITDGQIYLESDLFYSGVRPAINVGLSVSRVGGAAQTKKVKTVAGPLRLELAQYRELAGFAQFGADLDRATQTRLERGARIVEILKQPQFSPVSEAELTILLWIATNGLIDDIPVERIQDFETEFLRNLRDKEKKLFDSVDRSQVLSDELKEAIKKLVEKFKKEFGS